MKRVHQINRKKTRPHTLCVYADTAFSQVDTSLQYCILSEIFSRLKCADRDDSLHLASFDRYAYNGARYFKKLADIFFGDNIARFSE